MFSQIAFYANFKKDGNFYIIFSFLVSVSTLIRISLFQLKLKFYFKFQIKVPSGVPFWSRKHQSSQEKCIHKKTCVFEIKSNLCLFKGLTIFVRNLMPCFLWLWGLFWLDINMVLSVDILTHQIKYQIS